MNDIVEKTILSKAPWLRFTIAKKHWEELKTFCERNRILFEVHSSSAEEITYCVRNGLDAKDVVSYMLRIAYQENSETNALIHELVQLRIHWAPEYDYELHIFRTEEDEWLLSHFD